MAIWLGAGIKYPYINKCLFKSSPPPQNPYFATSSRAPSWVLADWWNRDSPESGYRWGSVVTPWQNSVSKVAVMSLTSLCLTAGKPPVLQVNVCLTLNGCPQLQWDGEFWNSQPYLSERLSWKQLCGEQNRVHLWEVLLARWRLPFPERVPWSIEQRVLELVGGFQHLPSASGVYFVKFLSSSSAELHDSPLVDGLDWWFGWRVGYWSAVKQLVALVQR